MTMHENAEGRGGRLLFTDFELSGKGRPADVALDGLNGASVLPKPPLSLRDVLASLDFSFESDGDENPLGSSFQPARLPDIDVVRTENVVESQLPEDKAATHIFDDFFLAFNPQDRDGGGFGDVPVRQGDGGSSMASGGPHGTAGGAESPEDSTAAWLSSFGFALENFNPGDDLLSMLPPSPPPGSDSAGKPGGDSLVRFSPPCPRPYGGIARIDDWYSPPEHVPDDGERHTVMRVDDWYEPPSGAKTVNLSGPFSGKERGTETIESAEDMFAGFDLDREWREALTGSNARHGRTAAPGGKNDTSVFESAEDIFAAFDLAREWKGRNSEHDDQSGGKTAEDMFAAFDLAREWEGRNSERNGQSDGKTSIAAAGVRYSDKPPGEAMPGDSDSDDFLGDIMSAIQPVAPAPPPSLPERETGAVASERTGSVNEVPFQPEGENSFAAAYQDVPSAIEVEHSFADDDELVASPPASVGGAADSPPPGEALGETSREDASPIPAETADMVDSRDGFIPEPAPEPSFDEFDIDALANAAGAAAVPDIEPPVISDLDLESPFGSEKSSFGDDDYLPGSGEAGDGRHDFSSASAEGAGDDGGSSAVNPMDVFASMDNEDFDDGGLDDDLKAMLADDESPGQDGEADAAQKENTEPPKDLGKIGALVQTVKGRFAPFASMGKLESLGQMLSLRQNWWFYCDLAAALIATASTAVIVSYFIWYRN